MKNIKDNKRVNRLLSIFLYFFHIFLYFFICFSKHLTVKSILMKYNTSNNTSLNIRSSSQKELSKGDINMKKSNIISVSFKNSIADLQIYQWLLQKSSYSGYIKDLLKREMEKEKLENGKR